ncbi:MAG: hypothetical protein AAFP85_15145 [Pseudomonadota bacterium]
MTNTPIGSGPTTHSLGVDQTNDVSSTNAVQFRVQDKGSATAELLRGQIGQLLAVGSDQTQPSQTVAFRELISPSAFLRGLVEQLQPGT